jgi:hypothetical protein
MAKQRMNSKRYRRPGPFTPARHSIAKQGAAAKKLYRKNRPWLPCSPMDRRSLQFMVQKVSQDPGSPRKKPFELCRLASSGSSHNLLAKSWSYLRIITKLYSLMVVKNGAESF